MPPKRARADIAAQQDPQPEKRRSARRAVLVDTSGAAVELARAKRDTTADIVVVGRKGRGKNKSAGQEREDTKQEKSGVKVEEKQEEKMVNGDSSKRKNDESTSPPAKKKTKQPSSSSKPSAQSKVAEASSTDADPTNKNDDRQGGTRFWLLKAEPETRIEKGKDVKFSIDDLAACNEPAAWDGVRNYGARNNMRAMKKGDLAFFYHSNCKQPGIVGIMEIVREASVDETAFDPNEPYYDPKSSRDNPKWDMVHVEFRRKLKREIGLQELKSYKDGKLKEMPLLKMGRLSVSEVPKDCWDFVLELEKKG